MTAENNYLPDFAKTDRISKQIVAQNDLNRRMPNGTEGDVRGEKILPYSIVLMCVCLCVYIY